MKYTKLILLFLFLLTAPSYAQWQTPKVYSSIDDQIEYLLAIREEIPSLIENGAEYDVDPFNIFAIQNAFVQLLEQQPEFHDQARDRQYLHTIRARYVRQQTLNNFVMSADAAAAAKKLGSGAKLSPAEFAKELETWSEYDGRGILTGLAMLQPDAVKREIFKAASVEQKIALLKANQLDGRTLSAGFRFKDHTIPEKKRNYENMVEIVEEYFAAEAAVWSAILWSFYKESADKIAGLGANEISQRLIDLGEKFEGTDAAAANFRAAVESRYFVKEKKSVELIEEEITLREVPGSLAVFRGIVGSDCATAYSCPIAMLPGEHTFFIYDGNGVLRGYLSGTRLKVQDQETGKQESAFYLHDFAGPRLSGRTAKLALAALSKELPALGMKRVVVPDVERMHANMNYKVISDAIESVMEEEPVTNVYEDYRLRQNLMNYGGNVDWSYDQPESNSISYGLVLKDLRMEDVVTEVSRVKAREITAGGNGRLSNEDATLLIMDLLAPEFTTSAVEYLKAAMAEVKAAGYQVNGVSFQARIQAANRIAKQYRIALQSVQAVIGELQNPTEVKLETYYNRAQATLQGLGLTLNDKLIEEHPHFFYEGHISAKDATSPDTPKMAARTIDFTIAVLRRWPGSSSAWNVILGNPEMFQKSSKFQNYLRTLLIGPEPQLEAFTKLLSVGFDFGFMNNERDIESLEIRRSNARSTTLKSTIKKIQSRFCETKVAKAG